MEETFTHFSHAQAIIRKLIFTDRLASLGGIVYNKSCHGKACVQLGEIARHGVHYLEGTNSWVHCIVLVSHRCEGSRLYRDVSCEGQWPGTEINTSVSHRYFYYLSTHA